MSRLVSMSLVISILTSQTIQISPPLKIEEPSNAVIEIVDIVDKPLVTLPTVTTTTTQQPTKVTTTTTITKPVKKYYGLTDKEIDLIALVTMAEAEGESEYGQRLVIDTVLNRMDHKRFPNTAEKVIYQRNQFTSMWGNRVKRCYVKDDIRKLVLEELKSRTNYNVIFFTSVGYSKYGKPLFKVGGHWFSSYS